MSRTRFSGPRFSGRIVRLLALAAGAVLATGTIAACGTSPSSAGAARSEPAGQVIARVHRAVTSARSVHMTGTVTEGTTTVTLDASFSGDQMAGTVGEHGETFTVLALGSKVYVKVNQAFMKLAQLPGGLCASFCGRYVELPVSSASQLFGKVSMSSLTGQAFSSPVIASAKTAGARFVPATADGRPVLQYSKGGYTLDVARTGPAYPVVYTGPGGSHITFSDWNSVRLPAPPPAGQIVNLNEL